MTEYHYRQCFTVNIGLIVGGAYGMKEFTSAAATQLPKWGCRPENALKTKMTQNAACPRRTCELTALT